MKKPSEQRLVGGAFPGQYRQRRKLRTISKGKTDCCHWWLIDIPNGDISLGRCKYCGAVKEFLNYYEPPIEEVIWAERGYNEKKRNPNEGGIRQWQM